MKIITDTASLYSPEEGDALGITVVPACAIVEGKVYKDYEDISCDTFLKWMRDGVIPTTSQPAIGEILDVFQGQEDILFLSIGDGLSGGYQNASGARAMLEPNQHIHVIDTKTLAGPEHYLVEKAVTLRAQGLGVETIKRKLQQSIDTSLSFVIPADFEFLKRSGRLTPLAAKIGGMIRIVPVLTQTEDKHRIKPFVVKRSRARAVEAIIQHFKEKGVDETYIISVAHAGAIDTAKEVMNQIKAQFSHVMMELFQLSPALMTHGGPGCVTIHAIKR